jgi:hypothetical protein
MRSTLLDPSDDTFGKVGAAETTTLRAETKNTDARIVVVDAKV